MKNIVKIIGLPILGLLIVIAGFVYDVIFAGIPYQDPTPEHQSRWEFHKSVAGMFYKSGAVLFLVGVIAVPVIWIRIGRGKCQL